MLVKIAVEGFMSTTAIDVLDFLRARLLDSLLWRQRLVPAGTASPLPEDDLAANYREVFAALAADLARQLADPAMVRHFIAHRRKEYEVGAQASA